MGKIPDCLDSGLYQTVCDLWRFGLRDRQGCDLDIVLHDKLLQLFHSTDLDSTDHQTDQSWVHIKHSLDDKATTFKIRIIGNGLS